MKVLVTGATGFVGRQFIIHFNRHYKIHALVRQGSEPIDNAKIFEYDGTIASIKAALNGVDVVVHLATFYRVVHQESDISPMLDANIVLGTQLLEAMKQTNTNRIVNIGTTWQKFGGEDYRYANLYAATKQAFQELLSFYADAYHWQCLNLHFNDTYGKGDHRKKIIQLLIETALNRESLEMSPGEQCFETCHIEDAVNAIDISIKHVYSAQSPMFQEYSILSGDDISLKDLVGVIERVIGLPIDVQWGKRKYREREVMVVPKTVYRILPGWKKNITLEQGVAQLISES